MEPSSSTAPGEEFCPSSQLALALFPHLDSSVSQGVVLGPLPFSSAPSLQSYSQRPEPSHVPSPTAPRKQDSQQVYGSCPAGQLYTIPSTLYPPQDPSWWAADTHKHTSPWVCYTHTSHTRPSLHHRQSAAAPCPAQSFRLLLKPGLAGPVDIL